LIKKKWARKKLVKKEKPKEERANKKTIVDQWHKNLTKFISLYLL